MSRITRRTILAAPLLAAALPAHAQEKVTLTLWHNHPEWKARVLAILARFEAEHPTVHVELTEMPSSAYVPRMNTSLAAGEAPDIIALNAGPDTKSAALAGYLADLTGQVDISTLKPSAASASLIDGKVYAVPILGSYTVGLYYNRDIFAKAKLTPPASSDEFFTVAKALKAQNIAPMIGPAQDGTIPGFLYMLCASSILGAQGLDEVRKGTRKLTDPDVLRASIFLRDLFPYFQPGALGTSYTEGKALFALGRGAMMEAGSADYAGFTETNPKVNLGVVPFPAAPGGKPSTVTGMQQVFGVNSKTKHRAEAIAFLQWMLGKEPAQMVVDTITLSTSTEVLPSDNRVMKEMIEASHVNDVRVWFEFPQVGKVFSTAGLKAQSLFLGELLPEDFAKALQDTVNPAAT
ncbi:MAG TPA: extracellular solute-binding protein [Acetobacteraceae bacterium]|jgi:raffinose/stachyose/melibiose transport system substrate-binding protein|nr:extracellular solute-binding protein [Acetobacteraceae bacterium]